MAEAVHFHVEQQLPELQDLLDKDIFTKDEIREIVLKRTKFEYKLKRRAAEKADFLAYIRYEKNLEDTRKKRVDESGVKSRHSISDHSLRQHIYHLYKRTLTKFKGDIELWLEYIDYAIKTNGKSVLDRVIASALSLHPTVPSLWIKAAEWEFIGKGNANAARILLQKAVRVLPQSSDLWLRFFRFELEFAARVSERREVLGIESDTNKSTVFNGAMAAIVHRHSLSHLPCNAEQQQMFFDIAASCPQFDGLCSLLEANIRRDSVYSTDSKILEFLTIRGLRQHLDDSSSEEKLSDALKQFSSAFPDISNSVQLVDAITFLSDLIPHFEDSVQLALSDKIDQIFQVSQEKNILDAALYQEWISLCKKQGLDYMDILVEAHQKYPSHDFFAYGVAKNRLASKSLLKDIFLTLQSVRTYDDEFWSSYLSIALDSELTSEFVQELVSGVHASVLEHIEFGPCLEKISVTSKYADFCQKILNTKAVGHIVYPMLISIEQKRDHVDRNLVNVFFAKLLTLVPSSDKIWLDYIKFALGSGDMVQVGLLYKRALENVKGPESFAASYDELVRNY